MSERPAHNQIYHPKNAKPAPAVAVPPYKPPQFLTEEVIRSGPCGYYGDGDGLRLNKKSGRGSWSWRYQYRGRRRDMGLGTWPKVSLSKAREQKAHWKRVFDLGHDPIEVRAAETGDKRSQR